LEKRGEKGGGPGQVPALKFQFISPLRGAGKGKRKGRRKEIRNISSKKLNSNFIHISVGHFKKGGGGGGKKKRKGKKRKAPAWRRGLFLLNLPDAEEREERLSTPGKVVGLSGAKRPGNGASTWPISLKKKKEREKSVPCFTDYKYNRVKREKKKGKRKEKGRGNGSPNHPLSPVAAARGGWK